MSDHHQAPTASLGALIALRQHHTISLCVVELHLRRLLWRVRAPTHVASGVVLVRRQAKRARAHTARIRAQEVRR